VDSNSIMNSVHRSFHTKKSRSALAKQVVAVLLLLCMVLPFLGAYTWLKYQQRQVKREVKHRIIDGLDRSELTLVVMTKAQAEAELNWEHEKEFEYLGEMYDVVAVEVRGDTIRYWCWWDKEETALNRRLQTLVAQNIGQQPQQNNNKDRLTTFFKTPWHFAETACSIPPLATSNWKFSQWESLYLFRYQEVPSPPPKLS
jgi:hypothetical protein